MPPTASGRWTWFQATEHLLPCTASVPIQRKPRISLTRDLRTQAGNSRLIVVWIGTADRVYLMSVNLPDLCMRLPFQTGILSTTLSISEYQAELGREVVERGMPK
jgi:hypothetical protein